MTLDSHANNRREIVPLQEILLPYWRRRRLILAITALSGICFVAAAFLMTPVYRSSMILIPAESNRGGAGGALGAALGSVGGLASLAGINLSSPDYGVEETLAVLQSREFTEAFIRDENIAPELFASLWDKDSGKWKVGNEKVPTLAKTYRRFEKMLVIGRNVKTSLITLEIDWTDSAKAAHWLNELIRRLNVEMRQRAIASADASVGYLQKEAASTLEVSTREAVSRLMEAQIRQRMIANVTQDYALRVIDKALIADPSDPVRPKKIVLTFVGLLLGLICGLVVTFFLTMRSKFIGTTS